MAQEDGNPASAEASPGTAEARPSEGGQEAAAPAGSEAARAVPAGATPARPYVLAVDESRLQLRAYEQAFVTLRDLKRFDVAGVAAPADAIARLSRLRAREPKPALILLEWRKPYASAQEFLNALRLDVRWSRIPVVLVAATAADGAAAQELMQPRSLDLLLKPIKTSLLSEKVGRMTLPESAAAA